MRRFLKIVGFSLAAIPLLSLLIVQILGGSISQAVVRGLNESLNTEITISDIKVSLLSSFPNLSVQLKNVRIAGSDGSTLLEAEQLKSRIGLFSLFGKIRVKNITLSNGALHLIIDADGNTNYQLLKYKAVDVPLAEDGDDGEQATFAIDDARLENIDLIYQNRQLQTEASIKLLDANLKGDFGEEIYDMSTTVNAEVRFIDLKDLRILAGESLRIGAISQVNNSQQSYLYKELYLGLGGLNLLARGSMKAVKDGWQTDLSFKSEKSELADLLRLIPKAYIGQLQGLSSRGNFALSGSITEKWTKRQQPKMNFRLSFNDGRLGSRTAKEKAEDINFLGEFSNGEKRLPSSSSFRIENLSGRFGREAFDLKFIIENFQDPKVSFSANGKIPIAALLDYLPYRGLAAGKGSLDIEQINIQGRYGDMLTARGMSRVQSSGQLTLVGASCQMNERDFAMPSGQLRLKDNALEINSLRLVAEGNDLTFNGDASNFIPVLFSDSLNTHDAALLFRASLNATKLDIGQLLALVAPSETEVAAAEESGQLDSLARKSVAKRAQITDLLQGTFDARFDTWQYGEMNGKNFRGTLVFSPQQLELQGQTAAMQGQWQLDGKVFFVESPRLEARVIADQVAIDDFFRQAENFGQSVLTSKHLSGRLDSKIYIRAYFSPTGELDYDRLLVQAGLGIREGELRDFEMLENFSAVLKTKDLERVRFSNLENYLEVSRSTVYIPALFIQSSAMNLTMSGTHTFSQLMDYNIKVNAGQVLANKIARHDPELEVLPAKKNGFFNLYYTILGHLDDYAVKANKRKVKAAFVQSEALKNRIRRDLEQQFQQPIRFMEEPAEWQDEGAFSSEAPLLDFSLEGGSGGR